MAISNPSRAGTAGELGNITNSEYINGVVALAVNTPFVYDLISRPGDLTGTNSATWTVPIFSKLASAASNADGAEDAPVALANTQATVSLATYLQSVYIGDQSAGLPVWDEMALAANRVVDSCRTKIDTDLLGQLASFTTTQGSAATVNTFDNVISAINAFRASAKNANGAIVMHSDGMRDLIQDLAGAIIVGSDRGAQAVAALTNGVQGPKRIDVLGMPAIESDRVPVGDSTGWSNAIVEVGPSAPLGLAFRSNVAVAGMAASNDMMVPVHIEMIRSDTAIGSYVRAWCHFGVGILDQARGIEFITRT